MRSDFVGPDKSFPIGDKKHARLAIGGATRSYNAGNISKSEENKIKSKARKKLHNANGKGPGQETHHAAMNGAQG